MMLSSSERKNTNILDKVFAFIEKYYYIFLGIVLLVAAFNLFYNLNEVPIDSWDEARHGANAYEMLKNKEFIVNSFGYNNDYYNLKPPLSYWTIMIGYKLAGFNALGLRLFSAISALLTISIVTVFVKYKHGKISALASATVLATTAQYILKHCGRTGDADSQFVLLFTISMISMCLLKENKRWLNVAGFAFSLAFLSKSWHAISILAVGGGYLIITGIILKLKLKEWIQFIISTVLPIFIWGINRYTKDGIKFFSKMISYDLLARTAKPLEGHTGDFLYYFSYIRTYFFYWIIFFAVAILIYVLIYRFQVDALDKNYAIAIILWIIVPLALFTKAETKLGWYIIPIYPALAIIIGYIVGKLLTGEKRNIMAQVIVSITLIASIYINEKIILSNILYPEVDNIQISLRMMSELKGYRESNIYTVLGSYGGESYWDQNHFFAAELYGDLIPKDEGIEGFISDDKDKSLIIISKDKKYSQFIKDNKLKIVVDSEYNYILKK